MASASCPYACPSVVTLFANCSSSPSALFLAESARRKRRLEPQNESESCPDVSAVDETALTGLGVQAAQLENTTLTVLYVGYVMTLERSLTLEY
jgi:hypothetical protein